MTSGALYVNPSSGARNPEIAEGIRRRAPEHGIEVVDISPALDVQDDIRKRMAEGLRLFIATGGDGTIHAVAQPLVGTEAVLGVIPVGTFNHFASDLQIPLDWSEALDVALRGKTIQVNVGAVNECFFLNNVSIGLYPEIAEEREQLRRIYPKWKAYRKAAWTALRKLEYVSLGVETPHHLETIRTHVFIVAVNPYDLEQFGIVAPRATLEGGSLSVYWLSDPRKPALIRALARYYRGKATPGTDFRTLQTSQLRVQTSHRKLKLGMDGELYELPTPITIRAVPKSLLVRVPRESVTSDE